MIFNLLVALTMKDAKPVRSKSFIREIACFRTE